MDPEKRSAVENHAEKEVRKHLEGLGYKVEKFGKPFDFLASKGEETVKVEVKGKQDYAITVEVTVNEVEVAKNLDGLHRTLLAVVDGIDVKQYDGSWKCSGGRLRTWWDMPFDESSLFPTRFQFTLPVE
jgi:myo-inositol-hexaphosphate 3-phosphohydrolase